MLYLTDLKVDLDYSFMDNIEGIQNLLRNVYNFLSKIKDKRDHLVKFTSD